MLTKNIMKLIFLTVFVSCSTPTSAPRSGSFTDPRDGKTYKTVKIGQQTWLAENLNYDAPGSFCYNDSTHYTEIYGRLYTWEAAKNACPRGWHLPDDEEWQQLEKFLGMKPAEIKLSFWRGKKEGRKLKSKHGWQANGNGTDKYGFAIRPSGYRGIHGTYGLAGEYGYCWTATEFSENLAWYRRFSSSRKQILRYTNNKAQGYPVRCIKDAEAAQQKEARKLHYGKM